MKALVFTAVGEQLSYQDISVDAPGEDEVVVALTAAALNHRDNWITKGMYPGLRPNIIPGSDGVGIADGREVIINPGVNWGNDQRFPGKDFHIVGMPHHGTFAEQIVVKRSSLVDKPAHLSAEQAAALPLAGVTAWRALMTRAQLQPGERVLISGIGGGVALFACQFAIAAGAEVWVTSSSAEKIERAVALGAKGGANYKEERWAKPFGKETGGFDVIIDSAGGDGFGDLVSLCNPGGRIAMYGGTRGKMGNILPAHVFFKQIAILGSTMGSDADFAAMVAFVEKYKIVPVVDSVYALADGNDAIARMNDGKQFGKIVLKI